MTRIRAQHAKGLMTDKERKQEIFVILLKAYGPDYTGELIEKGRLVWIGVNP